LETQKQKTPRHAGEELAIVLESQKGHQHSTQIWIIAFGRIRRQMDFKDDELGEAALEVDATADMEIIITSIH